jgi:hypothetical protein
MSLPEPPPNAFDVIFENILGFLLPFFLASAGGDADLGRAAIQDWLTRITSPPRPNLNWSGAYWVLAS